MRILGPARSGKTTRLRELAAVMPAPLIVCATADAAAQFGAPATTIWGLAAGIVERHDRPVRILSTAEQASRVERHECVAHYQASFLGREELRTHADAAGVYDFWEAIADATDDYLADLDARGEADWAGVLVRASLLLRDDDVLAAERARFSHLLVDDFESASFAVNRLLSQLAGFGGPIVVAGNPDNDIWRFVAGSARYLARFPRRFGSVEDVVLAAEYPPSGEGDVVLAVGPGGDPWLPRPAGPVPVALATSLTWESATLVAVESDEPDVDVLAGPDHVLDEGERRRRRAADDERRLAFARTRAQTVVQPPSTVST